MVLEHYLRPRKRKMLLCFYAIQLLLGMAGHVKKNVFWQLEVRVNVLRMDGGYRPAKDILK